MPPDREKEKPDLGPSVLPDIAMSDIAEFCRRWRVVRLEVFGSVLRDDFGPESDLDFLVTFDREARWSLFDLVDAQSELAAIVRRPVDFVEREPIEQSANWLRRQNILGSARTVYAA